MDKNKKERPIREAFKLNEIKNLIYDEKNNKCSFIYNDHLVSGKIFFFRRNTGEIILTKEI